jgi:hypothetical protein
VITRAETDALIEEATIDAYNEHEQITGLFTMLDEHLAVPFDTVLLGVTITVKKIDLPSSMRSSRSAAVTVTNRQSRFLTCRSRCRARTVRNGSTPSGNGAAERCGPADCL